MTDPHEPVDKSPQEGEPEAVRLVRAAREASAYAEGAARASWDSLIRAAGKTEEAARAWRETRDLETEMLPADEPAGPESSSDAGDVSPVEEAELAVLAALPREARRNLARLAGEAASRAKEAREIAQFASSMTSQAARAWGAAEEAWLELSERLNAELESEENV